MRTYLPVKSIYLWLLLFFGFSQLSFAQGHRQTFVLKNTKIKINVTVNRDGVLSGDSVFSRADWSKKYGKRTFGVASNAGFKLNFMWSSLDRAPGKSHNAKYLMNLTQKNFKYSNHQKKTLNDGTEQLLLTFKGTNTPLELRVVYQIGKNDFYARRKLEVRLPKLGGYSGEPYLRRMWPTFENLWTNGSVIKDGGLGKPVAIHPTSDPQTGVFWGMEFPTAQNKIIKQENNLKLHIGDYYGKRINSQWLSSNWVVTGLTPQATVRQWFMKYIAAIRAKPIRPYLLYNSWYDLEAPQNVHNKDRVMNEKNTMRSIKTLQRRLTKKRGVALNAFVLDDGWDTYRSPWKISKKQFPHGFKPLVKQLSKTNTVLGTWFGPIGGYSHHKWRVDWMKKHGYEVSGTDLDLAGKKYHQLLKKRVTDFTKNRGVAYYKWDGIQFSTSNPANGHPVGVYSRRAVMDSVISLSKAVWKVNPHAFLNITTGTWLSPWWVKYANTIWMQGGDYGYTKIPSISRRDRAITYRDFGLYNDFQKNNSWVPIANLMTHGIIKGKLQNLAVKEPLDKFTNNALLYFGRGVSMWELYISPDMLTSNQWDVLAKGIKWAKSRFPILRHTTMVGGDPAKGKPYGYAHFNGNHGIIAVRNPVINPQNLAVKINKKLGLPEDADSLVVERVYPRKKISPVLASSGSSLHFDLNGYEMAIYEIFPLKSAKRPLLAGATFSTSQTDNKYQINVLNVDEANGGAHLLNPKQFPEVQLNNQSENTDNLSLKASPNVPVIQSSTVRQSDSNHLRLKVQVAPSAMDSQLALLLKTAAGMQPSPKQNPAVRMQVDGQNQKVNQEVSQGHWGWYKIPLTPGSHTIKITLGTTHKLKNWKGLASLWFIGHQHVKSQTLSIQANVPKTIFPPVVDPKGTIERQHKLGEFNVSLK